MGTKKARDVAGVEGGAGVIRKILRRGRMVVGEMWSACILNVYKEKEIYE